jgi:ABC-type hemin transport system ATPase subunit
MDVPPRSRDSGVKLLRADAELLQADAVVIVLGPTGAGKSKFIREATGEDVEVGSKLESGRRLRSLVMQQSSNFPQ